MLDSCLNHLEALVSFDTRNPPRAIDADHAAVVYVRTELERFGFGVVIEDLGDGSLVIDSKRGESALAVNCHLDTVPAANGWTRDPFTLSDDGDRVVGLGACDVKGSAACVLAAAGATDAPARVVFTTDEEAGQARCVKHWAGLEHPGIECVLVCEPTGLHAVTAHRGLVSARARFAARSGHSSGSGRSAINDLVRWAHAVLSDGSFAAEHRFNLGVIEGGTKPNMIADEALARFGMRFPPGASPEVLLERVRGLAPEGAAVEWTTGFRAPALCASAGADAWIERLGLVRGAPVDFWTEAALFAEAGYAAIVCGAGDIAQAHAPDEWIAKDQLERACALYARVMEKAAKGKDVAHAAS